MNIIQAALSIVPVPYLSDVFGLFNTIYSTVEQIKESKKQLEALNDTTARLLVVLHENHGAGELSGTGAYGSLTGLRKLLKDILSFVQKETAQPFLKLIFTKEDRILQIEGFHRRMASFAQEFQISSLMSIQDWQTRNDRARDEDQRILFSRFTELEHNQRKLLNVLDANQSSVVAMVTALQRQIQQQLGGARERRFFSNIIQSLSMDTTYSIELEDWMVTPYDVEFGRKIGFGGFGDVYIGTWCKKEISLKVFRSEGGVVPRSEVIRREIKIWSSLRHPNILPFLGANSFDDRPFIVMPYMPNGNAGDFVIKNPNCNKLAILRDALLGLIYLHSKHVIHGDLKALNILIDHAGTAVLCDFGLSRVKADVTSRTAIGHPDVNAGSRNWMSPERLQGAIPRKPCDVYAFGMTIYEIFTGEIPLGHISQGDFRQLVVNENIRPEQPDEEEAPHLTTDIWALAEMCWVKDPNLRPTAVTIYNVISQLLDTTSNIQAQSSLQSAVLLSSTHIPNGTIAQPPPKLLDSSLPTVPLLNIPAEPSQHPLLKLKRSLIGHSSGVGVAAFCSDGKEIASCSWDGAIKIWDIQTGGIRLELNGHLEAVPCIAITPDGKRLVSGSMDNSVRIWDIKTGATVFRPMTGHTGTVMSVSCSPDGKLIISGSGDGTLRVWSAETGTALGGALVGHDGQVECVAFSRDSSRIASVARDQTLRLWDPHTGLTVLGPLDGHTSHVFSVAYSPDGTRIISGSDDETIRIWDALSGNCIMTIEESTGTVWGLMYSPDGRWIASSADASVWIWNAGTGNLVCGPVKGHSHEIRSVTFSPDGKTIVSAGADQIIRMYSFE